METNESNFRIPSSIHDVGDLHDFSDNNSYHFSKFNFQPLYLNWCYKTEDYDAINEGVDNLESFFGYLIKGISVAYFALSLSLGYLPLSDISKYAQKDAILPKKISLELALEEDENQRDKSIANRKLKSIVGRNSVPTKLRDLVNTDYEEFKYTD